MGKVDPVYLVVLFVLPTPWAGWAYAAVATTLILSLLVYRALERRTHRDEVYEALVALHRADVNHLKGELAAVKDKLQPIPDHLDNRLKHVETSLSALTTNYNRGNR